MDLDSYSYVTGLIYDAAIEPGCWAAALSAVVELFRSRAATLLTRNVETMRARAISTYDPEGQREYWDCWSAKSPLAAPATPRLVPVETDRDLLPGAGLLRTEFWNHFQRPRDVHTTLIVWLDRQGPVQPTFSVCRQPSAGEFERSDIELAYALRPHLQRAVTIADRLRQASLLSSSATEALDLLSFAVLILDEDGRPIHANRRAEDLLAARDGLFLYEGRLRAATPSMSDRLDAALSSAAGHAGEPRRSAAMALPRAGGRPSLALVAVPMRLELDWLGPACPAVCVCIADPAQAAGAVPARLAAVFGLTRGEAAVAAALAQGGGVEEIAGQLGISLYTARTHLARIMDKTDTRRQAELMRRLLSLPPLRE